MWVEFLESDSDGEDNPNTTTTTTTKTTECDKMWQNVTKWHVGGGVSKHQKKTYDLISVKSRLKVKIWVMSSPLALDQGRRGTSTTLGVWGGETDIVIFHFEPGKFYHKYLKKGLCTAPEAKIGVKQPISHILNADFFHFLHITRAS
jgi:hypothetical protein